MPRRPDSAEFDTPLTKEDLDKRRRDLSMAFRARAIQELVTVWKLLWSWRRRRRGTLP
jgi:hypothetical protein